MFTKSLMSYLSSYRKHLNVYQSRCYGDALAATVATKRSTITKGVYYAQVPCHSTGRRLHRSCVTGCFRIRHLPGDCLGTVVKPRECLGTVVGPRGCLCTVVNSCAQLGALVVEP